MATYLVVHSIHLMSFWDSDNLQPLCCPAAAIGARSDLHPYGWCRIPLIRNAVQG